MRGSRVRSALCLVTALVFTGCGGTQAVTETKQLSIVDPPRTPDSEAVLVFLPANGHTVDVLKGVRESLQGEFDVVTKVVDGDSTVEDMTAAIAATKPKSLVLMNNPTIALYQKYQAKVGGDSFPPAVMVMASYLERSAGAVKNGTGIYYEIPSVTVFGNLRSLIGVGLKRVGVVHRASFKSFVEKQAKLGQIEGFELIPVDVGPKPSSRDLKNAVRGLRDKMKVDAIWVLNDNALLTKRMIQRGWMPGFRKLKIPVVVGVDALVVPAGNFGSFAVLPDHVELGLQAGNMVLDLADNDWQVEDAPALPIAVKTLLHVGVARKYFKFKEDHLDKVDRVVE